MVWRYEYAFFASRSCLSPLLQEPFPKWKKKKKKAYFELQIRCHYSTTFLFQPKSPLSCTVRRWHSTRENRTCSRKRWKPGSEEQLVGSKCANRKTTLLPCCACLFLKGGLKSKHEKTSQSEKTSQILNTQIFKLQQVREDLTTEFLFHIIPLAALFGPGQSERHQ